jgi:F-type H+-transporting ATPase subunit delta
VAEERASKVYASAIFAAAKGANSVSVIESDLDALSQAFLSNPDLRVFLLSPNRSEVEKLSLFDKVFGGKMNPLTSNLIKLMISKRREAEVEGVHAEFSEMRRLDEGVLKAQITSAIELTDSEKKQITEKLSTKLGKKVDTFFSIDTTITGGVKVAYGEFVLDGTVKNSFNRLRESFRYDALKQA